MRPLLVGLPYCLVALLAIASGCQPTARSVPAGTKVTTPPPPPGGGIGAAPAAAGIESAPAPAAATASGLPADLIAKIDALIQCHKDYIAAAEKVQDPQAAKEQVNEFSQRAERGSAAYDDVMIAYGKLPADQKSKFEAYMDAHVLEINKQRRAHQERLEGLLRQSQ